MAIQKKPQTKFMIDQKVMTPISPFPAIIKSISIRRNPYNGYSSHNDVYNFYTVNVELQAVGKPEFISITTEYAETQLTVI